jgi:hypothetical protein
LFYTVHKNYLKKLYIFEKSYNIHVLKHVLTAGEEMTLIFCDGMGRFIFKRQLYYILYISFAFALMTCISYTYELLCLCLGVSVSYSSLFYTPPNVYLYVMRVKRLICVYVWLL